MTVKRQQVVGATADVLHQDVRFCTTDDGVRIAFATAGRGPPLVRVANWLTHLELEWGSTISRHWLRALAARHLLVRHDPRGSGLSEREVGSLELDDWVEDLRAVVDEVGLERFPLLGLGHAGMVALAFAARYPERVSRLVLFGCPAKGAYASGTDPRLQRDAEALERLLEVGWRGGPAALRSSFARLFVPEAPNQQLLELCQLQQQAANAAEACRLWRAFNRLDVTDLARQVRCATLVAHVVDDAVVPHQQGAHLAALIPGARLLALYGCNHLLLEREPAWGEFLVQLERFLAEDRAAADVTLAGNGAGPAGAAGGAGDAAAFPDLTAREREILDLIARGLDNGTISDLLQRSPNTVRNHITSIFSKLGVDYRPQAIVLARGAGLGFGGVPQAA